MISIKKVKDKFCSHCDNPAKFEIWFCNKKIIQQSPAGCLCEKCMNQLVRKAILSFFDKSTLRTRKVIKGK